MTTATSPKLSAMAIRTTFPERRNLSRNGRVTVRVSSSADGCSCIRQAMHPITVTDMKKATWDCRKASP